MAADLQRQCHDLLAQLRTNQTTLRQGLIADDQPSSLDNNLQTRASEKKPEYARQKLKSIMKQRRDDSSGVGGGARPVPDNAEWNWNSGSKPPAEKMASAKSLPRVNSQETERQERSRVDKSERSRLVQQGGKEGQGPGVAEAMQDYFESRTTSSLMDGGTDSFQAPVSTEDNTRPQPVAKPTTPTSVRRRRIIDRNVHVESKLSEADLRELEKDARSLNFSYSQQLDEEDTLKKVGPGERDDANWNNNTRAADRAGDPRDRAGDPRDRAGDPRDRAEDPSLTYHKTLLDTGNNRQLNNFVRDTTIKPKSILNSTQSFSSNYSKQVPLTLSCLVSLVHKFVFAHHQEFNHG